MRQKSSPFAAVATWFFQNHRVVTFLLLALFGFGVIAYTTLIRREGFPPVDVPIAVVSGVYPVGDPAKVDAEAAQLVAQTVAQVPEVMSVQSSSDANFFTIIAELESQTSNVDGSGLIRQAIESNAAIPESIQFEYPIINAAQFLGEYDLLVSVYKEDADAQELQTAAEALAAEFIPLDTVEDARAEQFIQTGQDPATGQPFSQQTRFGLVSACFETKPLSDDRCGLLDFFPAATIGIVGKSQEELDIFELAEEVNQKVTELNSQPNQDVQLLVAADFSESVNNQINSLESNVIGGILAITLISALMISLRVAFVTALFMIAVITTSIGVLFALGYSLNTITLFALVLALGLFVDDATIISESIDAQKSTKLRPVQIVKQAITRVGAASLSGSLTTVLVFVPLLFIVGVLGEFIFFLPLTVIIALLSSYILSITFLPWISRFTILTKKGIARQRKWQNPVPEWLEHTILLLKTRPYVGRTIGVLMVGLSIGFIGLSGYFAQKLSFNIFPQSKDSDEMLVSITYQPGTTIDEAQSIAREVGLRTVRTLGENVERVVYGRNGLPTVRSADALVELTPFTEREVKSPELLQLLEREFTNYNTVQLQFAQLDEGPPADDFPFKMQVFGEDTQTLTAAAQRIADRLKGQVIKRPNGTTARIKAAEKSNTDVITREDGRQLVQVQASYDADDTSALVQATQEFVEAEYGEEQLQELGLEATALGFDFGQESENEESFSSLGPAGLFALIAMFVLLAVQFRSILKPLLIFMALPFSLLGVTWGLYISDNPLSFFVMVGLIGLIGIAVNNTILLTDYANQERRSGKSPIDAVAAATKYRFRPLFTTTATTVAALAPLAMSDPFWEPLAITIMFGLLSSTLLVIAAFPYLYLAEEKLSQLLSRLGWRLTARLRRGP